MAQLFLISLWPQALWILADPLMFQDRSHPSRGYMDICRLYAEMQSPECEMLLKFS